MSDRRPGVAGAVLLALFVTFLWSSSWVLIRWGLEDEGLEPVTFAALRYGLAAIVLLAWTASRSDLRASVASLDRRSITVIVLLGVVFYAVTQGAQFVAIAEQPVATTSLILSLSPSLIAFGGGRSINETATRRQLGGTLLTAIGAWVFFAGELGFTGAGIAAAIVALLANVSAALLGRHVNQRTPLAPVVVTALSMGAGALLLVVAGLGAEGPPTLSVRGGAIVVWLAVVNTAFAFTLWNRVLRRLSALESVAINNTMLVQIALLGWLVLGEALGGREVMGIVLVSVGVMATQSGIAKTSRTFRNRQGDSTRA